MKQHKQSMLEGPLFLNIVTYTVPIILTGLLQLLFNAADLIVVGRFCGNASVAAVGATGAITNLIVNLFMGLSVGTGVSMAHAVGSKDDEAAHRTVHTALPTALISGIVLTVIGVAMSGTFLRWMGTPEKVLPLSTLYMQIYFGGMTFNMVYNFCASMLRAVGDTKNPLIFLTIAGVVNVSLNVLFVTVFHMDVAGVALATTISQALSAVLVVIALMHRKDASRLFLGKMRFYAQPFKKILGQGLPAGIQGALFSISNVIIQSAANSFGDIFIAGSSASSSIESFIYVCMNAFHQTALNFTGQNVGAHQIKRVGRIVGICLGSVAVVGFVLGTVAYAFGPQLLSIYITDSQHAIEYGLQKLAYLALPYFILGMTEVFTGILRGMGKALTPMLISIIGICGLRILWVYTIFQIERYHTAAGLYVSYPISWGITLIVQTVAYIVLYRKLLEKEKL